MNIQHEKPDIAKLRKQGYTIVDMHVHSNYSYDTSSNVEDILKKAKRLGIGIAIADHNMIDGNLKAQQSDILVIPAIEVESKYGVDVLLYFYKKQDLISFYNDHVKPNKQTGIMGTSNLTIEEIIKRAKGYRCLICFAHPYRFYTKKIKNLFSKKLQTKNLFPLFDLVEAVNSKNIGNTRAIKKAKQLNKLVIGGSDAHRLSEIANVVTCSKNAQSIESFLNNIKNAENIIVGKEAKLSYHLIRPILTLKNLIVHKVKKS
ncbi:MAG: PHP domain-containing protein [Nanoarchaeota archaeon]